MQVTRSSQTTQYLCLAIAATSVALLPLRDVLAVNGNAIAPWQPLTSLFVHGGLAHLTGNLFYLWVFGRQLEERWGGGWWVLECFIVCGAASGFFAPANALTIGASNGVYAVMVAAIMPSLSGRNWIDGLIVGAFALGLIWGDIQGLGGGGLVAHQSHLAGAIAGAAYWALRYGSAQNN